MASAYEMEPRFQALLRPLVNTPAVRGVTANQVTIAVVALSMIGGGLIAWRPFDTWRLVLLARMGVQCPRRHVGAVVWGKIAGQRKVIPKVSPGKTVAGFVGDVTIPAIKRDLGIKGSGTMISGHGGILDRVDGLTCTAPLFFFVYYFALLTFQKSEHIRRIIKAAGWTLYVCHATERHDEKNQSGMDGVPTCFLHRHARLRSRDRMGDAQSRGHITA